jgi:hypothetical protein
MDQKTIELNRKAQEFHKSLEDLEQRLTLFYQKNSKCSEAEAKDIDNKITKCLLDQPGRTVIWIAIVIRCEEEKVIERLYCSGKFERSWWSSKWTLKGVCRHGPPKAMLKVNGVFVHDEDELVCIIQNVLWRRTYQIPDRVKYFFRL